MKEAFLHYIWQYKLFSTTTIKTIDNREIRVLNAGSYNRNSGPDFLNAKLKIEEQIWCGNIEIHVNTSDWYLHQHEKDVNYDAVILHVVWQHDAVVFMKNNKPLPTLVLKDWVDKNILKNYKKLFSKQQQQWISCEHQIKTIDSFLIENWLERLFFERLQNKATVIEELLIKSKGNYEAVLFKLLAKNFGLKVNAEAFLAMAESFDFSVLQKIQYNKQYISALLFGQAGFLEKDNEEDYYRTLKELYAFLKHKYQLKPIKNQLFQFFRMRPANFPTIRIAQLAALYSQHKSLFSMLLACNTINDFYAIFSVEVDFFWKTHYTFETVSKKYQKRITKLFVDLLLINTILPLKFQYLKERGALQEEVFLSLIKQITAEKNSIISRFSALNITANNALESQALLELKNKYCKPKRCLECAVGVALLKNN
ncbi:DUF2851 family protein [Tenacibaculum sp. UWU-22]|uniref:DUF2851 family protein n=1 Tax=Tenacibaculum sp. UWU-22 TaxID=3234187 RepID=UPI0034DB5CFF